MLDKPQTSAPLAPPDRTRDPMHETRFAPGPDTARAFRDALGCYGTGVTVVTAMTDSGPLAMTANSFASVSLDPPLVLWCPAKTSGRHEAFTSVGRFAIHVMSETQQELARRFARDGSDFDGADWQPGPADVPYLSGCLAWFDCAREAVHDGGDHSIVVGRVLSAAYRPGLGLMFKRGQYGGFAGLD